MSDAPRGKKPYLIQRMSARSKNNQVRLSERYAMDYMGSTEFEGGTMGRSIRAMQGKIATGEFDINGIKIYAVWNTDNYNAGGVEYVLNGLIRDQWRLKEWSNFAFEKYHEQRDADKHRRETRASWVTNAWFDIEHGLFWTWQKINIKDIPLNLAKSVEWMDLTPEEQRARSQSAHVKPTLESKFGSLRQKLIESGQIKPR